LRLGHRESADLNFFSPRLFEPRFISETIPYLKGGEILRSAANDLTVTVDRGGPVQLSFFVGDVAVVRRYVDLDDFRAALEHAPPGIIDERSWAYWHVMTGRYPPPTPRRVIPI
jgi:hypothetical protein